MVTVEVKMRAPGDKFDMLAQLKVTEFTATAIEAAWSAESPDDGPLAVIEERIVQNDTFQFLDNDPVECKNVLHFQLRMEDGGIVIGSAAIV